MRIVLQRDFVAPPGDLRNMVSGTERSALLSLKKPFWIEKSRITNNFSAEYDGQTNNAISFMQRNSVKSAGIRFLDESRFLHECIMDDVNTVRLPLVVSSIMHRDGTYYSAMPLAIAKDVVRVNLGDALATCGFQVSTHDYYKIPMDKVGSSDYTIGELFGAEFVDMWPLVKSLSRMGPGEQMLQMLQVDSEIMQLGNLSAMKPVRDMAAPDEVDTILSLIAAPSLTSMFTYVNVVNAMQAVRFTKVLNPEVDKQGLTLFFYYAMQHSGFLVKIPATVYRALSAPDASGICTIDKVGADVLPTPLKAQLPPELRHFGPTLGEVSDTMFNSLMRARAAYKLLCVIRFLELKGIEPSPSYRFSKDDREKLFHLVS